MTSIVCSFCGDEVDPDVRGIFHRVEGWMTDGASGVLFRKELGEYAHKMCMEMERRGVNAAQNSLFD